ncbi:RidA family protein [Cupriavidus sp. D39]|uniref:RidA family protein n=1 Tax=Cupriavidus sp. D39 TaxID=2997877 RepID=UPI00226F4502|nr:RidA family protein [Cupriavidus sp. D39]MCY0855334.1 RidA family protein [Cupriavidus sp. D39]
MSHIERLRLPGNEPAFGSNRVFDLFQYAPAVTANGLAFIAGQVGMRADGSIAETPKEQIELAFGRLEAILGHLGLDFTDLVELVSYHVNLGEQLADFRAVKERFIKSDFPAWTILGVAALARPELVIEIKAVAAVRKQA